MTEPITTGCILFEEDIRMPGFLWEQGESPSNGWRAIKGPRSAFEKAVQEAGWTFFYIAGEIRATAFGFDRPKALHAALKRLIVNVKSQHCNGIEISQILGKSFCGVPYVSVSAHARHLQQGMYFSG